MAFAWIDLPDALEQHAVDHPEEDIDRLLAVGRQMIAGLPPPTPPETSGFYNRADVMRGDLADVARECLAASVCGATPVVQTEWFCQVEYTSPFLEALLQDTVARGDEQLRDDGQAVNVENIAHHVTLVWKAAQVGLHTNERAREMSIFVMSHAQRLVDIVNLINEFLHTVNFRLRELWQGKEGDLEETLTRNVQSDELAVTVLHRLMEPVFLRRLQGGLLESRMFGKVMIRLFSKLKPGTPVEKGFICDFIQLCAVNKLSHVVADVASLRFNRDTCILSQANLVHSVLSSDENNFNFLVCVQLAVVALLQRHHNDPVIDDVPVINHVTVGDLQRLAADIAEKPLPPVLADWGSFINVRNNVQADVEELSLGWSTHLEALKSRCEALLLCDLCTPVQRASLDEISTRLSDPGHLLPSELQEIDDELSLLQLQVRMAVEANTDGLKHLFPPVRPDNHDDLDQLQQQMRAVAPPRDQNAQPEDLAEG